MKEGARRFPTQIYIHKIEIQAGLGRGDLRIPQSMSLDFFDTTKRFVRSS